MVCGRGAEQAPGLRAGPWPFIISILQMASLNFMLWKSEGQHFKAVPTMKCQQAGL